MISEPTVRITFGPNRPSPIAIPSAPTIMTHMGMGAAAVISPVPELTTSTIAANGPTALATSFEPCAKLSKAAAKISGTVKS